MPESLNCMSLTACSVARPQPRYPEASACAAHPKSSLPGGPDPATPCVTLRVAMEGRTAWRVHTRIMQGCQGGWRKEGDERLMRTGLAPPPPGPMRPALRRRSMTAPLNERRPLSMDGPGRTSRSLAASVNIRDSGIERAGQAETDIVVPVGCVVPVAVGRAEVLWIVVPGTAAQNTTRGGRPGRAGGTGPKPRANRWLGRFGPPKKGAGGSRPQTPVMRKRLRTREERDQEAGRERVLAKRKPTLPLRLDE